MSATGRHRAPRGDPVERLLYGVSSLMGLGAVVLLCAVVDDETQRVHQQADGPSCKIEASASCARTR